MSENNSTGHGAVVTGAKSISPHNKALYEAGKKMLVDSVETGREFCKFMTTTSLSAIPIYVALLKLTLPKDYTLQSADEVRFLMPPILFLVSAIAFVLGYFPQSGTLSLDLPAEIERERSITVRKRHHRALLGFIVLCVGISYGSWQIVARLIA